MFGFSGVIILLFDSLFVVGRQILLVHAAHGTVEGLGAYLSILDFLILLLVLSQEDRIMVIYHLAYSH